MYYIQILNLNWLEKYLFLCKEKIMNNYYVYILTRERNSVFYTGVTQDLIGRVYAHKMGMIKGLLKNIMLNNWFILSIAKTEWGLLSEKRLLRSGKENLKSMLLRK
jgi:putative endonuclease